MRKHLIDKTKKSNIKCEHCKFFINHNECANADSPKYGKGGVNYWNRCEQFTWAESGDDALTIIEADKEEEECNGDNIIC